MSFTGQPIDDLLLSKISDKVGTIRESMLDEAEFNNENPGTWVLMDGRSCAGSVYASLSGQSNVPNMLTEGTFLRQAKAGRSKGSYEADDNKAHDHFVTAGQDTTGYTGQRTDTSLRSNFRGDGDTSYSLTSHTVFGTRANSSPTDIRGAAESRPKNIAVNFFIKIDY